MATEKHARAASPLAPGLYLVATPIGNLEDITLRAVRVLKEADVIACEDTRQTQKLLNHYGIATRTTSYHEHNEMTRAPELVLELEQGARIALVTDAGMPGISDPGYRLIGLAIRHHVPVVPIPGASAFLAALVASGLPTDAFRFSGFLPAKQGQRRALLETVRDSPRTQVFYEAPHRVKEALEDVVEVLGASRHVVVAREVTKLHEEFLRGHAADVLETLKARGEAKGEITLLIGKAEESERKAAPSRASVRQRLEQLMNDEKLDEKAALKKIAKEMGVSKSEAYRELQRSK
jgi:16S rRNA (cytidine1402-2'-O)-methyltransferase